MPRSLPADTRVQQALERYQHALGWQVEKGSPAVLLTAPG